MPKYHRPTSRADALAALAEGGGGHARSSAAPTCWSACGTTTTSPTLLVDLEGRRPTCPSRSWSPTTACRSARRYTMGELVSHPVIGAWYPALVEAALTVGSVAIRNRASLVGNSCNASPAADTAPPLLVHGARVTIASLDGDRTASLDEFFLGPRRTLCGPGELVTRLDLPRPAPRLRLGLPPAHPAPRGRPRDGQRRRRRRPGRRARARDGRGRPAAAAHRVPGPVDLGRRRRRSTRALDELLAVATPITDVRGSREYRLATLRVLTRRAVLAAADRRTPGRWPRDRTARPDHLDDDELQTVTLTVNGSERTVAVPTHRTLLDGLRDEVGLPGTKSCCAEGECGACTVLLDGRAVNSCLVLCVEAEGHEVTTVEGLSADGLTDLQEEFLNAGAVQCGFCIPGQVVSAEYLLRTNPSPDETADPRGAVRQPVPLRRLPAHRPRGAGHRGPAERAVTTAPERAIEQRDELGEPSDLYPRRPGRPAGAPRTAAATGPRAPSASSPTSASPARCRSPS